MAARICYLNGEFLPLAQAKVSVLDRGFIFGDAVYEVLIANGGRIFALAEHLARLERSLTAVAIANPLTAAKWGSMLRQLVANNGDGDQSIYVQVTRGVAERDHGFPAGIAPTVFAMSHALEAKTGPQRVDAIVVEDNRWLRCDIKSTALLPNVLLRNQALAAGAYEAILVRDGCITEGSASNVFVAHNGRVMTPPLSHLILPGVTRSLIIDVVQGNGIEVAEEPITLAQLRSADEIWLTSTTRDLAAVIRLDGATVGDDGRCPLAERAFAEFQLFRTMQLR